MVVFRPYRLYVAGKQQTDCTVLWSCAVCSSLKSSSVKVIGTFAHSGRAAGPSLMMVFTDLK
jgi:hypothetical protein